MLQPQTQLSALLDTVESGEDVEITRPAAGFDLEAFLAATTAQPLHTGSDAATLLQVLREGARY